MVPDKIELAQPSLMSLFVRARRAQFDPTKEPLQLATATAFVAEYRGAYYLVSNWHVVTGLDPITGAQLGSASAMPDRLTVAHNSPTRLAAWVQRDHLLYDDEGSAAWFVHPTRGREVDVIALPLPPATELGVQYLAYEAAGPDNPVDAGPSKDVSIIGFPFGRGSVGGIGIWARGTIASEPDLPYEGDPVFLIDSRTREGQSGSPVIVYSTGELWVFRSGDSEAGGPPRWELLGVYSGRISDESDTGRVWTAGALAQIIEGQRRDDLRLN